MLTASRQLRMSSISQSHRTMAMASYRPTRAPSFANSTLFIVGSCSRPCSASDADQQPVQLRTASTNGVPYLVMRCFPIP